MFINNSKNLSFKAYIPVSYYAVDMATKKCSRIVKPENIKKCQSFVVRNLNGTAKNNKNDSFVSYYSSFDRDYKTIPKVRTVYDYDSAKAYIVTGKDVEVVDKLAKPIGIAKSESVERTGESKSFETKTAAKNYFRQIKNYIKNSCRRLKTETGTGLELRVFYQPKFKKNGELKSFEYVNAQIVPSNDVF